MGLFTYRKRRRAKTQGEEQAKKAQSDEIDLYLKEEAKSFRRLCSVLLISSYPHIVIQGNHTSATDTDGLLGIPESEPTAFALVRQMKFAHGAYAHEEFADFRPLIWKILLKNLRSIVMTIESRTVSRSNKVRYVFYTFSMSCRRRYLLTGKLRVYHEPPNRH
jgi:hypothetical protein